MRLPFAVALLHRVAHVSGLCCVEEGAEEGDRGHGNRAEAVDGLAGEGRGCAVEGGVAEGVEGADEGWDGWEAHLWEVV